MQRQGNYRRGERHPLAKLTLAKVQAIVREYRTTNTTHVELGRKYGVCASAISHIFAGNTWRGISGR